MLQNDVLGTLKNFTEKYETLVERMREQADDSSFGETSVVQCHDYLESYDELANSLLGLQNVSRQYLAPSKPH